MGCNSTKHPLLLERVRRIKSTGYILLIPAFCKTRDGDLLTLNRISPDWQCEIKSAAISRLAIEIQRPFMGFDNRSANG
jgi:hypothetical protein